MRNLTVTTDLGQVAFWRRPGCFERGPIAVVFHGSYRTAEMHEPLQNHVGHELLFARLPGHRAPFLPEMSLRTIIAAFRIAFAALPKRPEFVMGESLGALVALGMGVPAVAVEPFLRTGHLWPLRAAFESARSRGMSVDTRFLDALLVDQDYRFILDEIVAPVVALAGDVPLMPERDQKPSPSLVDDEDFAAFASHRLVDIRRVAGGHALINENPKAYLGAIERVMERLPVYQPTSPTIL